MTGSRNGLDMQGDREVGFDWWSFVETVRHDKISSKKVGSSLSSRLVAGYGVMVSTDGEGMMTRRSSTTQR